MTTGTAPRLLAFLGLALLIPASSLGQDRPSLERIEAVMCAQAERDGDTYRPVFCPARCDCLAGTDPSLVESCVESSPGLVSLVAPASAPHDAVCMSTCAVGGGFCSSDGSCGVGYCGASPPACVDPEITCATSADCDMAQGFRCVGQVCIGPSCSGLGSTCATNLQPNITFGVAPAGDVTPLACDLLGQDMNSTDAAACIAFVEAELGAGACVICGDGNLDPGEQCDDGNVDPGDGCSATCTSEP